MSIRNGPGLGRFLLPLGEVAAKQSGEGVWSNRRFAERAELAFVVLGIAEPARSDQHDRRFGGADRLLQSSDPGQARRQLPAIEEGAHSFGAQDRVDLRRVPRVGARIAHKDIIGSARHDEPLPIVCNDRTISLHIPVRKWPASSPCGLGLGYDGA